MPGLGQRGVEHALLAEVGLQALGDAEDAAERADVLAHEQHAVVLGERAAQSGVERRLNGIVSMAVGARSTCVTCPSSNEAS